MSTFQVKAQSLPRRCEICHQADCFDPVNNTCSRCAGLAGFSTSEVLLTGHPRPRNPLPLNPLIFETLTLGLVGLVMVPLTFYYFATNEAGLSFPVPVLMVLFFLAWVVFSGLGGFLTLQVWRSMRQRWEARTPAHSVRWSIRLACQPWRNVVLISLFLIATIASYRGCISETGSLWLKTPIEAGDINTVRCFLDLGLCARSSSRAEETALNTAIVNGRTEIVSLFLEKGASVNTYSPFSGTPLLQAVATGNVKMVSLLLDKGAAVNRPCGESSPLLIAVELENLPIIKLLLEKGAEPDGCILRRPTPLMIAASKGKADMVQLLLSKGAQVNAQQSENKRLGGWTPLMFAESSGHTQVVKILMENGATPHLKPAPQQSEIERCSPLITQAARGRADMVINLLKNGVDVNAKTENGETALMAAAENGETAIVRILLNQGADFDVKDHTGATALMIAAKYGYREIVQALLKKGAHINLQDWSGRTALRNARVYQHLEIETLLRAKGAKDQTLFAEVTYRSSGILKESFY